MKRFWLILVAAAAAYGLADDGGASLLPDGPGKEVVGKVCVDCHSVDRMRGLRISKDDWWDKVNDMVDRGAKATDQESETLVQYLVSNFGKDSKVWVNTAPMVELKSVLGLTVHEGEAVVAYRQANGKFTQWSDLLKVPGVDAKKIEAKKELMIF
ncbi:MAG TPA: helix-hairpin-helix domain-containing protein [Candidatus Sulfopaludibacter sp.]|jgi:competence protein ComEA|nr:helix-hairpin-helix domain-containing protein [Candidatus Sulfopaludibacter sp.]